MWRQVPYLTQLEKAGIPTVLVDFEDQDYMVREESRFGGVPNIRFVHASRTVQGPDDVESWIKPMLDGLIRPLAEKEKERGSWNPGYQRILFEGTLQDAQEFYQQTQYRGHPVNAPLCVYTDGFPIIVPTEELVERMLKGTSHRPDELIALQMDTRTMMGVRKKGEPVFFQPTKRAATVEQVAVNAVMAGCRPEHLPVVLAMAESGCPTGTTVFPSQLACLSGPIVKELGLNVGVGMFGPGSPANGPIGRAYQLMAINLGGAVPGMNRMGALGSPMTNGGTCYAEKAEALPPGWKGLNEEYGFEKDESIVTVVNITGGLVGSQFSPGGYRQFQKSGYGAIARRIGVQNRPGPHNWLQYLVPGLWAAREGAYTFIMAPEMAQHLYDYGFKSKDAVYQWLWEQSFETVDAFMNRSWQDFFSHEWTAIEKTSGKPWNELPRDYMVPANGDDPFANCIIVAGGDEELALEFAGGRGTAYSIDAWR